MIDFLANQPHPECRETRCTTDGGVLLAPAVDVRALACCAWSEGAECFLCVVPESEPNRIDLYVRRANGPFFFVKRLCELPSCIRCINVYRTEDAWHLFALAGRGYLLSDAGHMEDVLDVPGKYVSAYSEGGQLYFLCDGARFRLTPDKRLEACGRIKAAPYFINTNRYDALAEKGTDVPGDVGGFVLKYHGKYLYLCAQKFGRCARENLDTFLCEGPDLAACLSRRYLLIPNGGAATLFEDETGGLSATFVGSTPHSAVFGKPAVVRLERQESGFWRLCGGTVPECSPVDRLVPSDNGGVEIRDTFVCAAPDGWYYLTGTTARPGGTFWDNTNGICLWKTKDLSRWEFVGKVFDYQEQAGAWQSRIGNNCWAPEICYHNDTYWITYSVAPGCGLLKSISGKPEGPYADCGRVVMNGIDSGFFRDDDGTLYLVWQNGRIAPFNADVTSFAREPQLLVCEDGTQVGYEGAGVIKVGEKYVLYAAEWNGDMRIDGTYDMMYAVSDSLYGPYSKRRLLIPHGGHGCLFYDREGRLRFTMFGNDRTAPFSRKAGIGVVEVSWEKGELCLRPHPEQMAGNCIPG